MTKNDAYKKDERQAIPQFASYEEEADFWDTHDMSDYLERIRACQTEGC
ncbi:MAG: CopG family antitoxin [Ktedonobacteraceae bacterium]